MLQEIVLTTSLDGPITAYDPSTGAALVRFNSSRCPRDGLTIVGKKLLAASYVSPDTGAGSVHLYNWYSPSLTHNIPLPEPVAPLAATVDGSYLFCGGISGQIHSLSVPSGDMIRSFPAHEKPISCLKINCDGSLLVSGSDDGTIAVFPIFMLLDASLDSDAHFHSDFIRFKGHESSVTGLSTGMGRSNSIVISSSLDWTCKLWSLASGNHLRTVRFPCALWGTVMEPMETEFYAAGSNGLIYKVLLKVQKKKRVVQDREAVVWGKMLGGGAIMAIEMLSYGQLLVTAAENGGIWIWEVESKKVIKAFGKEVGSVGGLVVAKGHGDFGRGAIGSSKCSYGSGNEMSKPVRDVMQLEEVLTVAVKDRSKAINELESAIGVYEKLMELMLGEARAITDLGNLNKNEANDR